MKNVDFYDIALIIQELTTELLDLTDEYGNGIDAQNIDSTIGQLASYVGLYKTLMNIEDPVKGYLFIKLANRSITVDDLVNSLRGKNFDLTKPFTCKYDKDCEMFVFTQKI